MSQSAEIVGEGTNVYGYDSAYDSYTNTTTNSTVSGNSATFNFVGTGLDIHANCTSDTGIMMIMVQNVSTGMIEKMALVNTKLNAGTYDASLGLDKVGTAKNVPIVSYKEGTLAYGEHKVTINQIGTGTLIFDGFRVYGTLEDADDIYVLDNEASPVYTELRDKVIASLLSGKTYEGQYAEEVANNVLSQVYASADTTDGALIVSDPQYASIGDNLEDFIDNSSKNELYLYPGQSLTFKLNVGNVQIGLRALNASVNYSVNNGTSKAMTSNTNMFYLSSGDGNETDGYTYTITNTSSKTSTPSVLAITDLKHAFGANDNADVMMLSLEEEDLYPAMRSLGFRMMRPTLANATPNITLNDENGNVVASTTLPVEGIEGDTAVVEAASILEAVKEVLPSGYEIVNAEEVTDVEIVYGESADVEVIVKLVKTETDTEGKAPETGDSTNVGLWISMMLLALGALVFARRKAN